MEKGVLNVILIQTADFRRKVDQIFFYKISQSALQLSKHFRAILSSVLASGKPLHLFLNFLIIRMLKSFWKVLTIFKFLSWIVVNLGTPLTFDLRCMIFWLIIFLLGPRPMNSLSPYLGHFVFDIWLLTPYYFLSFEPLIFPLSPLDSSFLPLGHILWPVTYLRPLCSDV